MFSDLSKTLVFDFWYNFIKKKYKDTAKLLMTDTDSLLFSCETKDIYEDMKESLDYFDTSEYPKQHMLFSDSNKKIVGKWKDETKGKPILEFVGLRSKIYSFVCEGDREENKRAKGIAKETVKKELKHAHYKATVFDETSMVSSMAAMRSHKHELFVEKIQKTGLSAFDDKRYLVDAVKSYSYGHYKIAGETNSDGDNTDECIDKQSFTIIPIDQGDREFCKLNNNMFMIGDFRITPCAKM